MVLILPQPSTLADNSDLGIENSWYHAKTNSTIAFKQKKIQKSYLLWNVITAETDLAKILNATSMHFVSSQFLKLTKKNIDN